MTILGSARLSKFSIGLCLLLLTVQPLTEDQPTVGPNRNPDATSDISETTQFRRPVALQLSRDGKKVVVANQKSGSISVLDAANYKLVGEFKIGDRISDLALASDSETFIAADQAAHSIVCFTLGQPNSRGPKILWKNKTAGYPSAIKINEAGNLLAVCGLWSRQLTIYENTDWLSPPKKQTVIELGFNPGHACWISADRLLVADAFGAAVAVIDVTREQMFSSKITGHRTGGLALASGGQHVAFSDQRLNPLARSTRNDVHWGLMIANQLRWLETAALIDVANENELEQLLKEFRSQPVGGPEDAKADLGKFTVTGDGTLAITVGGVNELAIGRLDDDSFAFVPVGKRPIAVTCAHDSTVAYVANQLDDSISVVDLDDYEVVTTIALGPTPELSLADHGQQLFYDARLSHDNWMSCHSCHVEGHTNGLLNDNFSDATFHTPKGVISLLGHGETLPLTWLGKHADFETQMKRSIESTMQADEPATDDQIERLAAFVRQLPAPPSVSRARDAIVKDQLSKGRALFEQLDCVRCHAPPVYTTPETYDLGVRDEQGESKFNPPSLIGLGQRDRYFHDGRYGDLAELLVVDEHEVPRELTDQELSDLKVFLKSL